MQRTLAICECFAQDCNVSFNAAKIKVHGFSYTYFKTKHKKKLPRLTPDPAFRIKGQIIENIN